MSNDFKRIFGNKYVNTFECDCCGKIVPVSEKKFLGNDTLCNKCFWTIRRIEQW